MANVTVDMCSVCAGTGTPVSGRPCVCGGVGTLYAEAQGLREELVDTLAKLDAAEKRADALAPGSAFAGWVLSELREEYLGCDLDGGDAQDAAVRYGMLEAVPVTASCGDDCRCAADDNIPGDCYRYTHAGKTAVVAHAFYPTPAPGAGGHDG